MGNRSTQLRSVGEEGEEGMLKKIVLGKEDRRRREEGKTRLVGEERKERLDKIAVGGKGRGEW